MILICANSTFFFLRSSLKKLLQPELNYHETRLIETDQITILYTLRQHTKTYISFLCVLTFIQYNSDDPFFPQSITTSRFPRFIYKILCLMDNKVNIIIIPNLRSFLPLFNNACGHFWHTFRLSAEEMIATIDTMTKINPSLEHILMIKKLLQLWIY